MAISLLMLVAGMLALAYASVPLYNLFCRVTGFAGTTQVADSAPHEVLEREVTVRFNSEVASGMPWKFHPKQPSVTIPLGKEVLVLYEATNTSSEAVTGTAVYNVTPVKVGEYFNKVQCFCFDEQTIGVGETVVFPVSLFVDPEMDKDPNMDEVKTITLSYTFFKVEKNK